MHGCIVLLLEWDAIPGLYGLIDLVVSRIYVTLKFALTCWILFSELILKEVPKIWIPKMTLKIVHVKSAMCKICHMKFPII